MEHLPPAMAITQLLQPSNTDAQPPRNASSSHIHPERSRGVVEIEALRLLEMTERTSDLMRSSAVEDLVLRDPILNVYHTFGELHDINVADRMAIAQQEHFHTTIGEFATESRADLVFLSWLPTPDEIGTSTGTALPIQPINPTAPTTVIPSTNPFDALFRSSAAPMPAHEKGSITSLAHTHFIRRLFASAPIDVALFVDSSHRLNGALRRKGSTIHLVVPFIGGPDDRLALEFVVQLCQRIGTTATIIRLIKTESGEDPPVISKPANVHLVDSAEHREKEANLLGQGNTIHSVRRETHNHMPA